MVRSRDQTCWNVRNFRCWLDTRNVDNFSKFSATAGFLSRFYPCLGSFSSETSIQWKSKFWNSLYSRPNTVIMLFGHPRSNSSFEAIFGWSPTITVNGYFRSGSPPNRRFDFRSWLSSFSVKITGRTTGTERMASIRMDHKSLMALSKHLGVISCDQARPLKQ